MEITGGLTATYLGQTQNADGSRRTADDTQGVSGTTDLQSSSSVESTDEQAVVESAASAQLDESSSATLELVTASGQLETGSQIGSVVDQFA